jgi:hypothetical protein
LCLQVIKKQNKTKQKPNKPKKQSERMPFPFRTKEKNFKMRIYTLNFHQLANEYHVTNGLK